MSYEAMFKRKSIRKYNGVPLSKDILNNIKSYTENLESLFPHIKTEFKIIEREGVTNLTSVKAPYYIAVFSEEEEGYLTNVGFMLEQIDLFLSSQNIGTCWVGMGGSTKEIMEQSNLKFVILLAFGNSDEMIHRWNVSEFNRKPVEKISNIDNELAQIVRLAPSGMNSQPWYFNQNRNEIDIYITRSNLVKNVLFNRADKINIGIAICYLWQVVKYNNCEVIFEILNNKEMKGYEYVITAIIK